MARGEPKLVPLTGGPYMSKDVVADFQRCINLYPEAAPSEQAPVPIVHFPTPGLTLKGVSPNISMFRCLYRATNGDLYAVVGNSVYYISVAFNFTLLGLIADLTTIACMADNGLVVCLVDGTVNGYSIDMTTRVMTQIADPAFYGSISVGYIDTFFIFNQPQTRNFYISRSGVLTFDPLDIVAKTGSSDPVQIVVCTEREAWVMGTLTSEPWYNAGSADFALAAIPGAFLEHGTVAPYSMAELDGFLFWVDQDKNGSGTVAMSVNYKASKISTFAIDAEIQSYLIKSDAIGYCYQQDGHAFYVLTFPNADKTWCYELNTGQWHERNSIDGNGILHRHRSNCYAFAYGLNLVGDFQNGNLYQLDQNAYTDNGIAIPRIRSWPHLVFGGQMIEYQRFTAFMETGTSLDPAANPLISLRWSDNGGHSFGNAVTASMGKTGQYNRQIAWNNCGQARDRIFELSWSEPLKTVLNGAFILPMVIE